MADTDSPVIIEAAINGVRRQEQNPNVPRSHAEIIDDALGCLEAGAAIIHAHNRSLRLVGAEAVEDYTAAWRPILDERPDADYVRFHSRDTEAPEKAPLLRLWYTPGNVEEP